MHAVVVPARDWLVGDTHPVGPTRATLATLARGAAWNSRSVQRDRRRTAVLEHAVCIHAEIRFVPVSDHSDADIVGDAEHQLLAVRTQADGDSGRGCEWEHRPGDGADGERGWERVLHRDCGQWLCGGSMAGERGAGADGRRELYAGKCNGECVGAGDVQSAFTTGHGKSKPCLVFVQNDGQLADTIRVQGEPIGGRFKVHYFDGAVDVTAKVLAGTLKVRNLAPGEMHILKVVIRARGNAAIGEQSGVTIRLTSANDANAQDAVRWEVTAK